MQIAEESKFPNGVALSSLKEKTTDAGVTVGGVLLKDGNIPASNMDFSDSEPEACVSVSSEGDTDIYSREDHSHTFPSHDHTSTNESGLLFLSNVLPKNKLSIYEKLHRMSIAENISSLNYGRQVYISSAGGISALTWIEDYGFLHLGSAVTRDGVSFLYMSETSSTSKVCWFPEIKKTLLLRTTPELSQTGIHAGKSLFGVLTSNNAIYLPKFGVIVYTPQTVSTSLYKTDKDGGDPQSIAVSGFTKVYSMLWDDAIETLVLYTDAGVFTSTDLSTFYGSYTPPVGTTCVEAFWCEGLGKFVVITLTAGNYYINEYDSSIPSGTPVTHGPYAAYNDTTISWIPELNFFVYASGSNSVTAINPIDWSSTTVTTAITTSNSTKFAYFPPAKALAMTNGESLLIFDSITRAPTATVVGSEAILANRRAYVNRVSKQVSKWKVYLYRVFWSPRSQIATAVVPGSTAYRISTGYDITGSASTVSFLDLAYSSELNLFVATKTTSTSENKIYTTPDTVTWTARTSVTTSELSQLLWVRTLGKFVALGTTAQVLTSSDGITWTITAISYSGFTGLTWCDNMNALVATTASQVVTSTNGTTWTLLAAVGGHSKIIWVPEHGKFYSVNSTSLQSSLDGITWNTEASITAGSVLNYCPELDILSAYHSSGSYAFFGRALLNVSATGLYHIKYMPQWNLFYSATGIVSSGQAGQYIMPMPLSQGDCDGY